MRWREDGKCGPEHLLPNGFVAQCNENGDKPCCNEGTCYGLTGKFKWKCNKIETGENDGYDYRGKFLYHCVVNVHCLRVFSWH